MSAFGRMWALKIRGCTVAEHFYAYRLGDRLNDKSGRCDPGRASLAFELEVTKGYLTKLFLSMEKKRFIERLRDADGLTRKSRAGDFRSNMFRLNFDRWFPFVSDEIEKNEKQLLGYFRRACESPELAQGFHSAWLEQPQEPNGKRNDFKKRGMNVRANRRRPPRKVLWIAVTSLAHANHFDEIKEDVLEEIEKNRDEQFILKLLLAYLKASD